MANLASTTTTTTTESEREVHDMPIPVTAERIKHIIDRHFVTAVLALRLLVPEAGGASGLAVITHQTRRVPRSASA